MKLTEAQEAQLREACERADPREACGIISGGRVFELPNASPDPGTFRLRASDVHALAAEHGLRSLDAVWHTHPSGNPVASDDDLATHPWPAALVIATRETVRVYRDVHRTAGP